MPQHRSSGILAHITSLPSPYGIGDIGEASYRFIEFLAACGQGYWQFLPTGPVHSVFDYSPYMSSSAFAGSCLLISPELLVKDGLLDGVPGEVPEGLSVYQTNYQAVETFKKDLLKQAFKQFRPADFKDYREFLATSGWLHDYAVFMAAKVAFSDLPWYDWQDALARHRAEAVLEFAEDRRETVDYFLFEQYIFHRQWAQLREVAGQNNIRLFGDLPIYVSLDSVDVWANQELFLLDPETRRPTHVSGVPPDYFSETGQRWGNPLYDWQNSSPAVQDKLVDWWTKRLSHIFNQVDTARIDHFRAFESYWAIPEECETAVDGTWLKGPGKDFFDRINRKLGPLDIVAEDLGIITEEVVELRNELGFPGMKVLQFAFDGNLDNLFLPYNFTTPNCVVYTGTHDNDTTVGWYLSDRLDDNRRAEIKKLANRDLNDGHGIHNDLIYLAMSSVAGLALFPLQDVLGFGGDCRMNTPGTSTGNWRWRCAGEFLTPEVAKGLSELARRFNRAKPPRQEQEELPEEDK